MSQSLSNYGLINSGLAPEVTPPFTMHMVKEEEFAKAKLRFEGGLIECDKIIERTLRTQLPPSTDAMTEEGLGKTVKLALERFCPPHGRNMVRCGLELLQPHLNNPDFNASFYKTLDAYRRLQTLQRVSMVSLLLDSQELTFFSLSNTKKSLRPKPGETLLEVLPKWDNYLPVTERQSFFVFGRRE